MGTTCGRLQRLRRLVAMDGDEAKVGIDVLLPRQGQHVGEAQLRGEGRDRDRRRGRGSWHAQPAPRSSSIEMVTVRSTTVRAARPETD